MICAGRGPNDDIGTHTVTTAEYILRFRPGGLDWWGARRGTFVYELSPPCSCHSWRLQSRLCSIRWPCFRNASAVLIFAAAARDFCSCCSPLVDWCMVSAFTITAQAGAYTTSRPRAAIRMAVSAPQPGNAIDFLTLLHNLKVQRWPSTAGWLSRRTVWLTQQWESCPRHSDVMHRRKQSVPAGSERVSKAPRA